MIFFMNFLIYCFCSPFFQRDIHTTLPTSHLKLYNKVRVKYPFFREFTEPSLLKLREVMPEYTAMSVLLVYDDTEAIQRFLQTCTLTWPPLLRYHFDFIKKFRLYHIIPLLAQYKNIDLTFFNESDEEFKLLVAQATSDPEIVNRNRDAYRQVRRELLEGEKVDFLAVEKKAYEDWQHQFIQLNPAIRTDVKIMQKIGS